MPINFAFALDKTITAPHEQSLILKTLEETEHVNVNFDPTMGGVTAAAKGGIDKRPGVPGFEKGLLFALNRYFASDVPGADRCSSKLAEVVEVMLDQQIYQVICLEDFGPNRPGLGWKPWQIRKVAMARDFRKLQENEAQAIRDARNPPAPINNVAAPSNQGIDAPVVNNGNAYANNPQLAGDAGYANNPGGGNYVNPNDLVSQRRATI